MDDFLGVFDLLVDKLVQVLRRKSVPEDAIEHVVECVKYTVPGGKMSRGLAVVETVKILESTNPPPELLHKARILGWMVEWMQGFFLVADDIMDESEMRRGKPCWYRVPGVGKKAINDSLLLQSCMQAIIREYFREEKCYLQILEEFLATTFTTEIGQLLDVFAEGDGEEAVNFDSFTMARYHDITTFKTAHYSFVLPVKLGLILCGKEMPESLKECLLEVGRFFQIQDDYLDAFGDPAVTGKIGTDIQEGKCSWLALKLMELMSKDHLQIFKTEYGKSDNESVQVIKSLYKEYNIESHYKQYESEMESKISKLANQVEYAAIVEMFTKKIFRRNK